MDDPEYRQRLVHDAAVWRREGLISEEQERALGVDIERQDAEARGCERQSRRRRRR